MVAAARRRPADFGPPPRRPSKPLGALKAELKRQRSLLTQLECVVAAPKKSRHLARTLEVSFMGTLPRQLHVQEAVFLSLLAAKAAPEDGLDTLMAQVRATASDLQGRIAKVSLDLGQLAGGGIMTHRSGDNLRRFCTQYRGYLSVMLSILVPLADIRFGESELDSLAAALATLEKHPSPQL